MGPDFPLAYHFTFGTYGMRLHGDARKTVHHRRNQLGEPLIERNDLWRADEASNLNGAPIELTLPQRLFVQTAVPDICVRGKWEFHTCACQPDHVHILLTSPSESKTIRRLLKRWLSEALSQRWSLPNRQPWWAEDGSIKWIWKREYLETAYDYIFRQRAEHR